MHGDGRDRLRVKHAAVGTADRDTARLHDPLLLVDSLLITEDAQAIFDRER